jgi:histidine ammonia-lyase
MNDPISLGPDGLTQADVVAVAREGRSLSLSSDARQRIAASAAVVERIVDNEEIAYGVTTGFGSLADTVVPVGRSAELQTALIRSHAAGMGAPVEREVVRAMIALRARSLAMGYSGVRTVVVQRLLDLLDHDLTPLVPEFGSLGASGDLAPLAHVALTILGEGSFVTNRGDAQPAAEALSRVGLEPLRLRAKEGLALINGTDGMLGMLVLAIDDLRRLSKTSDIVAACSVEGLMGTDRVFAADLQALRPQVGQAIAASNLCALLADSSIIESHRENDSRVQDAYSLRCTPVVHGSLRDVLEYAGMIADRELVAAIDNPMILPDGRVESCGNFHGAPIAQAADFLAVAVADLSALSERRTDRMLDRNRSHGLPPFLAADPGVDSGMMIGHYTQAAMVAENRRLAAPASVDTIPTSALQEDHVSMGWSACRKLRSAVVNLRRILAVELVVAARAVEIRELKPGRGVAAAVARLRREVPGLAPDRWLAPELSTAEQTLADPSFVDEIAAEVGGLE